MWNLLRKSIEASCNIQHRQVLALGKGLTIVAEVIRAQYDFIPIWLSIDDEAKSVRYGDDLSRSLELRPPGRRELCVGPGMLLSLDRRLH